MWWMARVLYDGTLIILADVAEYVLDKCIENVKEIPKFQHEFIEGYEHEGDKWKPEELTTDKNAIPLSTMVCKPQFT